jgi:hypothetical protein
MPIGCLLHSRGSGRDRLEGSCQHGNGSLDSVKGGISSPAECSFSKILSLDPVNVHDLHVQSPSILSRIHTSLSPRGPPRHNSQRTELHYLRPVRMILRHIGTLVHLAIFVI